MRTRTATAIAACASLCFLASPAAPSQAETTTDPTIIVSFDRAQADPEAAATQAVQAAGGHVADARAISTDTVAVTVTDTTTSQTAAIENAVEDRSGVRAAETARPIYPTTTGDFYYSSLWNLNNAADSTYGVDAEDAWSISTGSGAVIGVIDTGIVAHPDLDANVIAGYDFVSDLTAAGDGDGWDADPTDVGTEWHGTHVAGIAAARRNSIGVVGVAPEASIEPIRALGINGGNEQDLIAAIYWGAGLSVDGVATNTHPADVLNLSLAGDGDCSTALQAAIDGAVNSGTAVVVAVGNGDKNHIPLPIDHVFPGDCKNVIRVVATTKQGTKAGYSNYGTSAFPATVSAPGGDASAPIRSTWGGGGTDGAYADAEGTSMASPHVAGVIALLRAVQPDLTVDQLTTILTSTTKPAVGCSTDACGAGIVAAPRPMLGEITFSGPVKVGVPVRATAAVTPAGTAIHWTWRLNGVVVSTSAEYTPVEADLGGWLWAHAETDTNLQANNGALVGPGSFTSVVRPGTTGTFRVGRTVKASKGTWGPTPTTYRYQWYRGSTKISKATKSSYKLTWRDRRKKVWVKITAIRTGYTSASASSTSHKVK